MTKTQANEPGFVLVPRDPTEAMLDAAHEVPIACFEDDVECFTTNREASSLYRAMLAAAPIVPALAYGVKALEWHEVTEARSDEDPSHEPTGDYEAVTDVGIYYVECAFGSDSYVFSVSLNGEDLSNHDDPVLAKAAAQADFERRILSCLSSAPVEEADAKAGGTVASDFLAQLRAANRRRDAEYRAKTNGEPLPILFRTTEFAGEVGELLNVIKKMERERLGWGGKRATREAMLEEFGGVLATLDLLAMSLDVDLAEATAAEFNAVTIRLGLTTCLTTPPASTIPSEPEAKGEAGAEPSDLSAELQDELESCITGTVYLDSAGTIMDAPLAVGMILDVLRRKTGSVREAGAGPVEVLGRTYDGVDVLAPAVPSQNFTREEARSAVERAMAEAGPVGEVVAFVMQYGGRCRDCADCNGYCQGEGLPCEPKHAERIVRHVLKAVEYGRAHGFISSPVEEPGEVERLEKLEPARRAVQKLGGILSLKPHSREHDLSDRYLEWVQLVEKAHADIRDALARAALSTQESSAALAGDGKESGR